MPISGSEKARLSEPISLRSPHCRDRNSFAVCFHEQANDQCAAHEEDRSLRRRTKDLAGRDGTRGGRWIAATAIAHHIPILAQDADYDLMPDAEVIKI